MFTKIAASMIVILAFTGCAQQIALRGIPDIADGEQSRWIYHCDVGNVAVEYANRSGRYSATVETADGKQVLDIIEQNNGNIVAVLLPLRWASQDGVSFSLSDGDHILLDNCRAIAQEDTGNIHINLSNIFGKK